MGNEPLGCCCFASQSSAAVDGDIDASPFLGREHIGGLVVARHILLRHRCNGRCHFMGSWRVERELANVANSSTLPILAMVLKLAAIERALSLVNRKKLIRCAEHDDHKRG